MQKKLIPIIIASLMIGGCYSAKPDDFMPVQLPSRVVETAKNQVRYAMKDPGSAQFREIRGYSFSGPGNGYVVCGMVNGKNSYGGYSGFKPFRTSVNNSQSTGQTYINEYLATVMPC